MVVPAGRVSVEEVRFGEADLTTCDRKPIHIQGSIQPHGELLGIDPERVLGLSVSTLLEKRHRSVRQCAAVHGRAGAKREPPRRPALPSRIVAVGDGIAGRKGLLEFLIETLIGLFGCFRGVCIIGGGRARIHSQL
jgi:hypothetical protein